MGNETEGFVCRRGEEKMEKNCREDEEIGGGMQEGSEADGNQ